MTYGHIDVCGPDRSERFTHEAMRIWGNNSRILELDEPMAVDVLDQSGIYDRYKRDSFWEGYVYGTETEIVSVC